MSPTWTLTEDGVSAQSNDWQLEIKPTDPTVGVVFRFDQRAIWNAFRVSTSPGHQMKPEQVYVRGHDLIARFDQAPADQFAIQFDWRLLDEGLGLAGLEMWVSIQTDDLQSHPVVQVNCESPSGQPWRVYTHRDLSSNSDSHASSKPAALVCPTDAACGVWLVEPTDHGNANCVSAPEDAQQQVELFGQFIEKGVIRRARMRFHVIPGKTELNQLCDLYQAFSQSPLPLTA